MYCTIICLDAGVIRSRRLWIRIRLWLQICWRNKRLHNIHCTTVATAAENTLHSLPEPVEETTPSFLPRS